MMNPKLRVRKDKVINKKLLKKNIIHMLENMYVNNLNMNTDIDSYNCGIHDAVKKIKTIL